MKETDVVFIRNKSNHPGFTIAMLATYEKEGVSLKEVYQAALNHSTDENLESFKDSYNFLKKHAKKLGITNLE